MSLLETGQQGWQLAREGAVGKPEELWTNVPTKAALQQTPYMSENKTCPLALAFPSSQSCGIHMFSWICLSLAFLHLHGILLRIGGERMVRRRHHGLCPMSLCPSSFSPPSFHQILLLCSQEIPPLLPFLVQGSSPQTQGLLQCPISKLLLIPCSNEPLKWTPVGKVHSS